jgi:hypothetical protein
MIPIVMNRRRKCSRVARFGWTIALLLTVILGTGGCPPPRQRDKDQQTGLGQRRDTVATLAALRLPPLPDMEGPAVKWFSRRAGSSRLIEVPEGADTQGMMGASATNQADMRGLSRRIEPHDRGTLAPSLLARREIVR